MGYIRAWINWFTGWFSSKTQSLQANKHVMAATYDKSIKKTKEREKTVMEQVAEMTVLRDTRVEEVLEQEKKLAIIQRNTNGAKIAMQERVNELRAQGVSREKIEQDGEFLKRQTAYVDGKKDLTATEAKIKEKKENLALREKQLVAYQKELIDMRGGSQSLEEEKVEAIADVTIAASEEAIEKSLSGLSEDTVDKDLEGVRKARKLANAKTSLSSTLRGSEKASTQGAYADYADQAEARQELDDLIDWGEDAKTTEEMSPAKIPDA